MERGKEISGSQKMTYCWSRVHLELFIHPSIFYTNLYIHFIASWSHTGFSPGWNTMSSSAVKCTLNWIVSNESYTGIIRLTRCPKRNTTSVQVHEEIKQQQFFKAKHGFLKSKQLKALLAFPLIGKEEGYNGGKGWVPNAKEGMVAEIWVMHCCLFCMRLEVNYKAQTPKRQTRGPQSHLPLTAARRLPAPHSPAAPPASVASHCTERENTLRRQNQS